MTLIWRLVPKNRRRVNWPLNRQGPPAEATTGTTTGRSRRSDCKPPTHWLTHSRGIVHRDIKPSNLILDSDGVVWVSDFGLAKADDEGLTQTGDFLGTARYMSPERFRGECDFARIFTDWGSRCTNSWPSSPPSTHPTECS